MIDESQEIAERLADGSPPTVAIQATTPAGLLTGLNAVYAAAERTDRDEASAALAQVIATWPSVEGSVAAKSQDAYTAIEQDLGKVSAALKAEPVDRVAAKAVVERLREAVAPFSEQQAYTAFDAAAIVLREGLEALLVVAALLAFLRRSNNQDKQAWIWAGAGIGILLSIVAAVVLQAVFNHVAAGQNREIIEGVTGLLAAAMLFYVSYWLHSKASLRGWQRYIDANTTRALARGNLIGLAMLAVLAVFREGAETTIFYLGMAPSIQLNDLLLGLALGIAVLVVAAWLMLVVGVKLPLRLFFRLASILVFYLGFKFVGTGIHALQVAGAVPSTPVPYLPSIPVLGIYPTWETLLPQVALLAIAGSVFLYLRFQDRRVKLADAPAAA